MHPCSVCVNIYVNTCWVLCFISELRLGVWGADLSLRLVDSNQQDTFHPLLFSSLFLIISDIFKPTAGMFDFC